VLSSDRIDFKNTRAIGYLIQSLTIIFDHHINIILTPADVYTTTQTHPTNYLTEYPTVHALIVNRKQGNE
jgi:hypothetical protein